MIFEFERGTQKHWPHRVSVLWEIGCPVIKKGIQAGKQRYQCRSCGRKFTYDTKQITAYSHQPVDSWVAVIEDTLSRRPLDKTAKKIGVCHETAFSTRHKRLAFLEAMMELEDSLDELVEADETYVIESQKRTKCEDRKPGKHGEGATKRDLSHEQYCVCVATDRNDHVCAVCVNSAAPSGDDIISRAVCSHNTSIRTALWWKYCSQQTGRTVTVQKG